MIVSICTATAGAAASAGAVGGGAAGKAARAAEFSEFFTPQGAGGGLGRAAFGTEAGTSGAAFAAETGTPVSADCAETFPSSTSFARLSTRSCCPPCCNCFTRSANTCAPVVEADSAPLDVGSAVGLSAGVVGEERTLLVVVALAGVANDVSLSLSDLNEG